MKIRLDKYSLIFLLILVGSIFFRLYKLSEFGYSTDEPVIITAGIKYFLNSNFDASLYDMAAPTGQWPAGLFINLFSGRDFSAMENYGIMDYSSIDFNLDLLKGLEFLARLPSALMGIIASVFVYLLVKEMYGQKAGLFSFALFSFNPILVDYSRIALLEIFQIGYMIIGFYFLFLAIKNKKNSLRNLIVSGAFLGLTIGAKFNGLILIPFFCLVSCIPFVKNKKDIHIDFMNCLKSSGILIGSAFLVFLIVFGFDLSVPKTIYDYYSQAGGTGLRFVLFDLFKDAFFYINPVVWILVFYSLYLILTQEKKNSNADKFSLILLGLIIFSGFFEAQESIKRGVQFVCLFFIIVGKVFEKLESKTYFDKIIKYAPLFIVVSNIILMGYYFPNTGLAKNIICISQNCIESHDSRNFDSRIAGEYFNDLENITVFDPIATTGLIGFYTGDNVIYLNGGIAKLAIGECPSFELLKANNVNYIINNSGCLSVLLDDLKNCPFESIYVKNYEMTQIYNIDNC